MIRTRRIGVTVLAEGYNAFETSKSPQGVIKYLGAPQDVISLLSSGKLKEHILLVRGGTTTFLSPALSMGAIGIITMSGAPESHLGILSREFQTPCVMTVHLADSDSRYVVGATDDSHFEAIRAALEGKTVRLDVEDSETGRIVEI
jgi:PEP-utilising enzyme, mobile domain